MPLTSELRARLEDYNSRNAPDAFGEHRYTAEEYGLTDETIRDSFEECIDRFEL
jgi:hypothetical protein